MDDGRLPKDVLYGEVASGRRMDDGRLPQDVLYGELAGRKTAAGHPHLRFKDVCKRYLNLKALNVDVDNWGEPAGDRSTWRQELSKGLRKGERRASAG